MPQAKHIVCLIDDDNIYQYTARVILEATGLAKEIHSFYNAHEALAFFTHPDNFVAETLPDLIFLDINMPVMDGWAFLEEYDKFYTRLPKPIHIYMVSSSVNSSDMQRSRSYRSVSDYLVKPVNRNQYQELMENL